MKVISTILVVYLLALAMFPCSDKNTCTDEKKAGVFVASTLDHDHSSNETDFCSPFCICSCCSAHIQVRQSQVAIAAPVQHNAKLIVLYLEHPSIADGKSIWQPPRA